MSCATVWFQSLFSWKYLLEILIEHLVRPEVLVSILVFVEVSLRVYIHNHMIEYIKVSILVFVEVSLRVASKYGLHFHLWKFQSLFSWKYLLEDVTLIVDKPISVFQSLFSWKYLLEGGAIVYKPGIT